MITKDRLIAAIPSAIACALAVAAILGIAWLVGVRKTDTMLDGGHARAAFAAVKRAAGPRMQVRKIKISRDELTVLAFDSDMPEWRYVPAAGRSNPGHWYDAPGIFEQSWRVSRWTVFGHDWYRVSGPEPEGRIQQREGDPFDLRPEDILDLPDLLRKAAPDPTLPNSACGRMLILGPQWWTVCLDAQGAPLLVFLQAR
jgi:hypothetical protein